MRIPQALIFSAVFLYMQSASAANPYMTDLSLHLRGGITTVIFTLDMTLNETGSISGDINVSSSAAVANCIARHKIAGLNNADGTLQFKTTSEERDGCIIIFKGSRQGDDLIGTLKFLGRDNEVTFKKK